MRPAVQGAALVLDNKTGRILAMAGGFSYPLSQLNRTTQSQRQPGSALKPLTYLAALQKGLQPNTLVRDEEITLPPIGGGIAREQDYWTPKNYDGGEWGVVTLRRALENSRNLATVNLLDGGIDSDPHSSLDRICALALEAQIYRECVPYYPFVLGAQPVRPIDLAAFYAAIANEGVRPTPYVIESIEHNGLVVYRHEAATASRPHRLGRSRLLLSAQDHAAGRAGAGNRPRDLASSAPYVAGKTGTTEGENDAWFMGFTNDVTVAVWVGYDNADGKRRTLGGGQTGASVAIPIFEPIIQAVWAQYAPKTPLNAPLGRGQAGAGGAPDQPRLRRAGRGRRQREIVRRIFPARPAGRALRHAIPAGVARRGLYGARNARRRRHAGIPAAVRRRRTVMRRRCEPWRAPPAYNPQQAQPQQRRDAYGQPYGQPLTGRPTANRSARAIRVQVRNRAAIPASSGIGASSTRLPCGRRAPS